MRLRKQSKQAISELLRRAAELEDEACRYRENDKRGEKLLEEAADLRRQAHDMKIGQLKPTRAEPLFNSFSKWIVGGVMFMFFVGVGVGVYQVIWRGEQLPALYDFISWPTYFTLCGYFAKAFGENILRELFPDGVKLPDKKTGGGDY